MRHLRMCEAPEACVAPTYFSTDPSEAPRAPDKRSLQLHPALPPAPIPTGDPPTRPPPGGRGGDLQKEGVWHIETVGVGSSWS